MLQWLGINLGLRMAVVTTAFAAEQTGTWNAGKSDARYQSIIFGVLVFFVLADTFLILTRTLVCLSRPPEFARVTELPPRQIRATRFRFIGESRRCRVSRDGTSDLTVRCSIFPRALEPNQEAIVWIHPKIRSAIIGTVGPVGLPVSWSWSVGLAGRDSDREADR